MRSNRFVLVLLVIAALGVSACAQKSATSATQSQPGVVEPIKGTSLNRVVLSPKAAELVGIKTEPVRELSLSDGGAPRKVVPYVSVVYLPSGGTFIYTNPEPLVYVLSPVTVDYIEGDRAVLLDGPPSGTAVVTVGSSELLGVEFGVGK